MELAHLAEARFVVTPLYWCAAVAYVLLLKSKVTRGSRAATALLGLGAVLHIVEYIGRGALAGHAGGAPFTGVSGFLSLAALVLAICYLVLEMRTANRALGAFCVPAVAVLHTSGALLYQMYFEVPTSLQGPQLVAHVTLIIMAYVGLSVALVTGVTYLILDFMLRRKRPGPLFRRLPNLGTMTRVHRVALLSGAVLLACGFVAGALWAKSVWGFYFSWREPKLVITLVGVCITASCTLLWRSTWWRGRRVTWLAVSSISLMFLAMALSRALTSELHRFA